MVSLSTFTPTTTRVGSMLPASPNLYIMKSGQQFYVNGVKVLNRNLQATSDVGRKRRAKSNNYSL